MVRACRAVCCVLAREGFTQMRQLGKQVVVVLIAAHIVSSGCSSSTPTFQIHSGNTGGVSYEIRGSGHASESRSANGDIEANLGSNRLEIKDGRLQANGKDYGPVKKGDEVILDEKGEVAVNGTIRH